VWQNDNGAVSIWEVNGTALIGGRTFATNPRPSWHIYGAGDYNHDGRSDLLFQN
jgi:hypothetical protein